MSHVRHKDCHVRRMPCSRHARIRGQQRGLPEDVLRIVYEYGRCYPGPGNAEICLLDKEGHREARAEIGDRLYRRIADKLSRAYLVCTREGRIITAGHRYKPILH